MFWFAAFSLLSSHSFSSKLAFFPIDDTNYGIGPSANHFSSRRPSHRSGIELSNSEIKNQVDKMPLSTWHSHFRPAYSEVSPIGSFQVIEEKFFHPSQASEEIISILFFSISLLDKYLLSWPEGHTEMGRQVASKDYWRASNFGGLNSLTEMDPHLSACTRASVRLTCRRPELPSCLRSALSSSRR